MQKFCAPPNGGLLKCCDKGVKMSRIVTKFKTVSPDRHDAFEELYQQDENIMPCELYVDKTTGTIYFIE
jgi:hypothetical protein